MNKTSISPSTEVADSRADATASAIVNAPDPKRADIIKAAQAADSLPSALAPSGLDGAQIAHAEIVAQRSPFQRFLDGIAFLFSALLSPYLVIPFGTVGIVYVQSSSRRQFLLWTFVSVLFSTIVPALYVVLQIWRGKITDVHVMEREQRSGPFVVAVISSALGALVLHMMGAPRVVWGIGLVLLVNGVVLLWITTWWKISMHVAVLSSVVVACAVMIPALNFWSFVWLIPALMWARWMRGRHTVWQGLGGCFISCALTVAAFSSVGMWPLIGRAWARAVGF